MSRGRPERGGKQRIGFCTDSSKPHVGLELMTHEIMTGAKIRWSTN